VFVNKHSFQTLVFIIFVIMTVSQIDLYNILKKKLGDQEAESLVSFVKTEVQEKINDQKDFLATKEDLNTLKVDLANTKAEVIKWMFVFWIGQLAALFALIKFAI